MNAAPPLLLARIENASRERDVDMERIAALLNFAYSHRRKKRACLDLLILDDAEIARLNKRHLRHDGATDVLAFEDGEPEDGMLRLGDIAISAETARREATERNVAFENELSFYALHGLLHLLGMTDELDEDRARMHQAQVGAMRDFGLRLEDAYLRL